MLDITYPPDLIAAQTRSHQAWEAVEAHRKEVDQKRRAEATPVKDAPKWAGPALREWSAEENARHAELMAEATAAAEALHAALAESGLGHGYDTVQGLHKAARAE
jgi:transposase